MTSWKANGWKLVVESDDQAVTDDQKPESPRLTLKR